MGHAFGVRVDGAAPRGFLRFLSLTAFQAEGGGGGFAANFIMPPLAALSTHKRQVIWQRSSPPCYLPTPFPGVGGERSETEGGGWMGHSVARGSKGSEGKVLKMDRPLAGGFLSLTGLWPEGGGIAHRAMSIKSTLRD